MRTLILAFIALAGLAAGGCAEHYIVAEQQLFQDEKLEAACLDTVKNIYPKTYTLQQRVVLNVWDREFDFSGCLAVKDGVLERGVSYGDMGGKLFEFCYDKGRPEILFKPDIIPEKALCEGMIGDLEFIQGVRKYKYCRLLRQSTDHFDFLLYVSDDEFDVYMFKDGLKFPEMAIGVRCGVIYRVVSYLKYADSDGSGRLMPCDVLLHNYQWHYKCRIRTLKITDGK